MTKLKVTTVKLTDLVDDPDNARTHDAKNLGAIRESLVQFGQVEPLVVQRSSKRVIGGNGRLEVMRQLKWTHAEVVLVDLDDAAATSLAIALNRTPELAAWDRDKLSDLLRTVAEERPGLVVPGFSESEMAAALSDQAAFLSTFTEGGGGGSAGPTGDAGARSTYVDLVLSLTPENRAQVYAVLNKVKERCKLATSSDALVELCRHYERTSP